MRLLRYGPVNSERPAVLSGPATDTRQLDAAFDISSLTHDIDGAFLAGGGLHRVAGPWLVTPDEVDVSALSLSLDVNGQRKQSGSTADMVFGPAYLVWYLSQFLALEPGDLIDTGTPAGVGAASNTFLTVGDTIDLKITGLGAHRNNVVLR